MARRNVVRGQTVAREKLERAKILRTRMTVAENKLWQSLRGSRLDGLHFRRQQVIDGFIADFYCNAAGLVIEVDGAIHEQQEGYDRARDEHLARRNLLTIRLTNQEIMSNLEACLDKIRTVCRQRIANEQIDATPVLPSLPGKGDRGLGHS